MAVVGRPCNVCKSEDLDAVNDAILSGETPAKIAVRFGIGKDSISNHKAKHMGDLLVEKQKELGEGGTALVRLERLYDRANALLAQAELNGNAGQALQAVRELRTTLESIAKITGELNDKPTLTINLAASPEWLQLQGWILAALAPYQEAKLAVLDAIELAGEIEP